MKNSSIFWAIVLALGIFSCSDEPVPRRGGEDEGGGAAGRTLRVFTWGEYVSPRAIEIFTERTGIAVEITEFDNGREVIAAVHSQPGEYDVITVDDPTLAKMMNLSLLRKIDHSKLGNLGNLNAHFLDRETDPGNRYSGPYHFGGTVVAYRKDKIPDPEKSWKVLFKPELSGKIAMLDEYEEVLAVAKSIDGRPLDSMEAGHILKAKNRILDQIRRHDIKFGTYSDILDAMGRGDIWAAMNYNGDIAMVAGENPEIDFFIPEEGAILWFDSLVVSRDSRDPDAAHQFLNFMMEGEIAAESANYLCLASPNRAADPHLDEGLLSDPRINFTDETLAKGRYLRQAEDPETSAVCERAVREILEALRAADTRIPSLADTRSGEGQD